MLFLSLSECGWLRVVVISWSCQAIFWWGAGALTLSFKFAPSFSPTYLGPSKRPSNGAGSFSCDSHFKDCYLRSNSLSH